MSDNKNKLRQQIKQQHSAHLKAVKARWMKKLAHDLNTLNIKNGPPK
ncbi:hypothetical protein [Photobacterium nomapromontoriensis]